MPAIKPKYTVPYGGRIYVTVAINTTDWSAEQHHTLCVVERQLSALGLDFETDWSDPSHVNDTRYWHLDQSLKTATVHLTGRPERLKTAPAD